MEYNTCRDLCLQVIWAYIQPFSLELLGNNLDTMLLTVNSQVVRTLCRPSYTFEEVEDMLWNYYNPHTFLILLREYLSASELR